jgi:hypothetical protein
MGVRRLNHDGAKEKAATRFSNIAGHKIEKPAPAKSAEVGYEEVKKLAK